MNILRQFPALGRDLGLGLIFIGLISLTAVIVACIYAEWTTIIPMLTVAVSLCGTGLLLRHIPQNGVKPSPALSVAVTALLWGFVAICGSLPFLFMGLSFTDAAFESMSAWTGTGFSIAENLEEWPHAFLFWRSLMQWVGCLGIVVFTITVAAGAGSNPGLYRSEGRGDSTFLPSVSATATKMLKIYIILTVVATAAVLCTGVGIWDSINLSLCSVSTGGFTLYSDGLSHYNNLALELVLIPVMFLGAIPFRLYYFSYTKRSIKEFLHDRVIQVMFALFVIVSAVIVIDLIVNSGLPVEEALREGVFMSAGAISSTGFQNTDFMNWGFAPLLILGIFMFVGGPRGSTAGGVKLDRFILAAESFIWWVRKTISSSKAVISMRHLGKNVKAEEAASLISGSVVVILSFVVLLATVFFIFLHDPYFAVESSATLFDLMNCVANTGATTGLIGPNMPEYAKIIIFFVMWAARLEIIPFVILIGGIARVIFRRR